MIPLEQQEIPANENTDCLQRHPRPGWLLYEFQDPLFGTCIVNVPLSRDPPLLCRRLPQTSSSVRYMSQRRRRNTMMVSMYPMRLARPFDFVQEHLLRCMYMSLLSQQTRLDRDLSYPGKGCAERELKFFSASNTAHEQGRVGWCRLQVWLR